MKTNTIVVLLVVMVLCSGAMQNDVRPVRVMNAARYQMMEYKGLVLVMDSMTSEVRTVRLDVAQGYKAIEVKNDTKIKFFDVKKSDRLFETPVR